MASVNVNAVQLEKAVTKAVEDYRNTPGQWIADYVAPRVAVLKRSGFMPRFGRKNQKLVSHRASPFAPTPRVDYDLSSTEYECSMYRGASILPSELIRADDTGLLTASGIGLSVDEALRIEREAEIRTLLYDTTDGVTAYPIEVPWNESGSTPVQDCVNAALLVDDAINRMPQYVLMTRNIAMYFRVYIGNLRSGGGGFALGSLEDVASLLGVKEVRVLSAGYDSAVPGADSTGAKLDAIATGGTMWIFHKPDNPSAYAPVWAATPYIPAESRSRVWSIDDPEGFGIAVHDMRDTLVVDKGACVILDGLLSEESS